MQTVLKSCGPAREFERLTLWPHSSITALHAVWPWSWRAVCCNVFSPFVILYFLLRLCNVSSRTSFPTNSPSISDEFPNRTRDQWQREFRFWLASLQHLQTNKFLENTFHICTYTEWEPYPPAHKSNN